MEEKYTLDTTKRSPIYSEYSDADLERAVSTMADAYEELNQKVEEETGIKDLNEKKKYLKDVINRNKDIKPSPNTIPFYWFGLKEKYLEVLTEIAIRGKLKAGEKVFNEGKAKNQNEDYSLSGIQAKVLESPTVLVWPEFVLDSGVRMLSIFEGNSWDILQVDIGADRKVYTNFIEHADTKSAHRLLYDLLDLKREYK